jgi:CubicO group peptidase (beta-lactamase class C family)
MIIQRVTHGTYAGQLTKQIITPLHLHSLCYAPSTCPAADAALMPAGYFFETAVPSLLGKAMPPLAETWAQAAGAIVSSLADMTTWDRVLYQGQELPPPSSASSKASSLPPPASPSAPPRSPIRLASGSASAS